MNKHRRDAGFSLAALIFFAAAASILAAAAVPAYQMQAKREREKELLFRGEEYARAIKKYHDKFNIYPGSIDQLIQTNGLRFLRRAYKDPITGKDFRLLRLNPDGTISGSRLSQIANPKSLFGDLPVLGENPSTQPPRPNPSATPPRGQPPASPGISIGNAVGTPIASGGIVGVASDSDEASVMVYNQRQKYSEFEVTIFSLPGQQQQRGPQVPGQVSGQQIPGLQIPGQQPQMPGQSLAPGGQPPNTPFPSAMPGAPSSSPFGQQPGGFGSFPGPQQGQQPFGGFGNNPTSPLQPGPAKRP